jgi:hypothetical protein
MNLFKNIFFLLCLIQNSLAQETLFPKPLPSYNFSPVLFPKKTFSLAEPACPSLQPHFNFISSAAENSLTDIFKNMSCVNATNFILPEHQERIQCDQVRTCDNKITSAKEISQEERYFLKLEAMDFVVRENVDIEMGKYTLSDSRLLRRMIDFSRLMPEVYQKQINYCRNASAKNENCLNDSDNDHKAKISISQLNAKAIQNNLNFQVFSYTDGLNFFAPKLKISTDYGIKNDRIEESLEILDHNKNSDEDFKAIKEKEIKRASKLKSDSTFFTAEKDEFIDPLLNEIQNQKKTKTLSSAQIADFVKKAMSKITPIDDQILGHNTLKTPDYIDESIDKMKWSMAEIDPSNKKLLSRKLNELRVKVANKILDEECKKSIVSVDQLCANISESLKSGEALNQALFDSKNIFERMIESIKTSGLPDAETKIARLKLMSSSKDKIYEKYLKFILNYNNCQEMYPDLFKDSKDDKEYNAYVEKQRTK